MIVGLTGRAQHGKDFTARVLAEFGFKRYAFADQLKSMALVLNPYIDSKYTLRLYQLVQDQGWDGAKENPEVRRFLQVLGTEGVREHLGEDAWVAALEKHIRDDTGDPNFYARNIVITDVRFPNEARWVTRNQGGVLWRIRRINLDGTAYDNGLGADHPSEQYVDSLPVEREIVARTKEELAILVRAAGEALKSKEL